MKYFDKNMNTYEARGRYYELLVSNPVPEEEKETVRTEYVKMIEINIKRERQLAELGFMC